MIIRKPEDHLTEHGYTPAEINTLEGRMLCLNIAARQLRWAVLEHIKRHPFVCLGMVALWPAIRIAVEVW